MIVSSFNLRSTATVKILYTPPETSATVAYEESAQGDGGYDAFMNTIHNIAIKIDLSLPQLADYSVTIPPGGHSDAIVQCTITWGSGRDTLMTKGVNSDQVLAAAEATEKMINLWVMKINSEEVNG